MVEVDERSQNLWENIISVQSTPTRPILFLTLIAAVVLISPPAWHYSRNLMTAAHEGGHALVAILFGRRLAGIKLNSDTSGVTISSGKPYGFGAILTVFAGYISPGLMGLGLAYLLSEGRIVLSILILTILLALMFLMIRNFWGLLIVAPSIFVLYWISENLSPAFQGIVVCLIVWFLTLGSIRPIVELQIHRMKGEGAGSDADQLRKLTLLIPGLIWVLLFAMISLISIGLTLELLLLN